MGPEGHLFWRELLQQILAVWSALDMRRRLIVGLATITVFAAVLAISRGATTTEFSLLYSGLENTAAGEVVQALEQRGVRYDIRGSSIFVDAAMRDELRLTLAAQGLPANGAQGYELLDGLSGFGTTSQMFDAAYWRAKEGELARTIVASPLYRSARVHISNAGSTPFRGVDNMSASVSVSTTTGGLSVSQAQALRYLISSAVAGLLPDDVAVIDGNGGLVAGADERSDTAGSDRAHELKLRVERLLEARVGPGNAVVEVSIDTVTESETIIERRIDPEGRVAISTESEARTTASQDAGRGNEVTVASNLPTGDAEGAAGSSTSENSETRERTNYEISETQREVQRLPGAIRRITVAVLVNATTAEGANGVETVVARDEAELEALRELVASAVGFDDARGDVVTIKSLAFEPPQELGTPPVEPGFQFELPDTMSLIQLATLAIVALVLGLFVVRPILTSNRGAPAQLPGPAPLPEPAALAGTELPDPIGGPEPAELGAPDFAPLEGAPPMANAFDLDSAALDDSFFDTDATDTSDPVSRLRNMIDERRSETVQVLQNWMDDSGQQEKV